MGSQGDHVSRALALILADDRRPPDDEEAVARLWRDQFRLVPDGRLEKAVVVWLKENPRGRPNLGKIWEILKRLYPEKSETAQKTRWEDEKRTELEWACSILERPDAFQHENYKHTLMYAAKCLAHHGFTSWESAREWLSPGWTPPVYETYLS